MADWSEKVRGATVLQPVSEKKILWGREVSLEWVLGVGGLGEGREGVAGWRVGGSAYGML